MESEDVATLLSIVSPWPIAITLATYLPAGDLINLARTSVLLRAALHGFQPPSARDLQATSSSHSRPALRIGGHQTSYWRHLKQAAQFLCASPSHTKGSSPRPCRYCSAPICEACIVKDSFAKRAENTFKNRSRFLCNYCWSTGNPHRRCRITGKLASTEDGQSRYNFPPGGGEFCTCTSKNNGWVCIGCKDVQNAEANAIGFRLCFGDGCNEVLEEDKYRRRICLWCDRPMLRARASVESCLAFDQKLQDARAKRGVNIEDGARKQTKLYKMSRRELRGDEAIAGDLEDDVPQFVRHLDTVNYQRFMPWGHTPSGEQVYQSKLGRWVYNRSFLAEIGKYCRRWSKKIPKRSEVRDLTRRDDVYMERTNLEKREQQDEQRRMEEDAQADSLASQDAYFATMLHLGGNSRAEALGFQDMRRSFFLPTESKAAENVTANPLESESLQSLRDDYTVALALENKLDRKMAADLDAEFAADADTAEAASLIQFKSNSAESDSDRESPRNLTSHNFASEENGVVKKCKHPSQGNGNGVDLTESHPQLRMVVSGQTSNLGDPGNQSPLRVSGSQVAPEQVSDSGLTSDEVSDITSPQTWPGANIGESGSEADIKQSRGQLLPQPFPDDRPPTYSE